MKWFSELIERELNFKSKSWLDKMGIKNYTIRSEGTVDVDGGVDLNSRDLDKIPVKFGKVLGYFLCRYNRLTDLGGSPKEAGEYFDCSHNLLTSPKGGLGKQNIFIAPAMSKNLLKRKFENIVRSSMFLSIYEKKNSHRCI